MPKKASSPTRVAADVTAAAVSVAQAENRTVAEQIDYWARLGMEVERSARATSRRVLDVVAGHSQFSALTAEERTVAHATIDARMSERVARARFGAAARNPGHVTVPTVQGGNPL